MYSTPASIFKHHAYIYIVEEFNSFLLTKIVINCLQTKYCVYVLRIILSS